MILHYLGLATNSLGVLQIYLMKYYTDDSNVVEKMEITGSESIQIFTYNMVFASGLYVHVIRIIYS